MIEKKENSLSTNGSKNKLMLKIIDLSKYWNKMVNFGEKSDLAIYLKIEDN